METFPELNTELHDTVEEGEKIGPKHFVMIRLLGVGAMGKVILVRCVINNKLYAMKMINKKSMNTEKAMDYALYERRVLSKLRHPFLISLLCSFQTNDNLYLITTFCQGGELFKHIIDNGFFDEVMTLRGCDVGHSSFLHRRGDSGDRQPALLRDHPSRHQAGEHPPQQHGTHRGVRLRRLLRPAAGDAVSSLAR